MQNKKQDHWEWLSQIRDTAKAEWRKYEISKLPYTTFFPTLTYIEGYLTRARHDRKEIDSLGIKFESWFNRCHDLENEIEKRDKLLNGFILATSGLIDYVQLRRLKEEMKELKNER